MSPQEGQDVVTFVNAQWTAWAMNQGMRFNLSGSERLILVLIASHISTEWRKPIAPCWPSRKLLSRRSGATLATVDRAIRRFKNLGMIERRPHRDNDGYWHKHALWLHLEPVPQPIAGDSLGARGAITADGRDPSRMKVSTYRWRQFPIEEDSKKRFEESRVPSLTQGACNALQGMQCRSDRASRAEHKATLRAAAASLGGFPLISRSTSPP